MSMTHPVPSVIAPHYAAELMRLVEVSVADASTRNFQLSLIGPEARPGLVTRSQYFATCYDNSQLPVEVNPADWDIVLFGEVDGVQVSLFRNIMRTPALPIRDAPPAPYRDMFELKPNFHGSCAACTDVPCPHLVTFARHIAADHYGGVKHAFTLTLDGLPPDRGGVPAGALGVATPPPRPTLMQELTVLLQPPASDARPDETPILPEGARVGVQVVLAKPTSKSAVRLEPACVFAPADGNVTLTLLPAKNSTLWQRARLPSGEVPWRFLVFSILPAVNSSALLSSDGASLEGLLQLIRAGRCFDEQGATYALKDLPLSAVLAWVPVGPEEQRLALTLPGDYAWADEAAGLVVSLEERTFAFTSLPKSELLKFDTLPALANADVADYLASVADLPSHWALPAPHLLPPMPVMDVHCGWHVHVHRQVDKTYYSFSSKLIVTVSAACDDKLFPPEEIPDGWQLAGDTWARFTLDREALAALSRVMRSAGFNHTRSGSFEQVARSDVTEYTALRVQLLCTSVLGAVPFVFAGFVSKPPLLKALDLLTLEVHYVLVPDAQNPTRLLLAPAATLSGKPIDLARLVRSQPASLELERVDIPFQNDPPGVQSSVREIANGQWIRVDARQWDTQVALLRHVLQVAERDSHTRQLSLQTAQLLGLAFEGHLLPGHAGELQRELLAAAKALLDAQATHGSLVIKGLAKPLKPVQTHAVSWMLALREKGFCGVLADDRGLGKTVETLATILEYKRLAKKSRRATPPVVIAMEVKELGHWEHHLQHFTPKLSYHRHHGPKRRSLADLGKTDVIITTYDILRTRLEEFLRVAPEYLFLDEATALKNAGTARWATVSAFRGRSTIIPITGTPIGRNISDLWSLMELAMPGLLGTAPSFQRQAQALSPQGIDGPQRSPQADEFVQTLRNHIAPFLLRRKKEDYPDQFPEKVPVVQYLTLSDADAADYEKRRILAIEQLAQAVQEHGWHGSLFRRQQLLDALRQKASYPGGRRPGELSSKGLYLVELTKELLSNGHRILIFSHFNNIVSALQDAFNRAGIANAVYMGEPRGRDRELALFKNGHVDVLILAEIGKSGLDIPEADTVIINDPWIDPSVIDQMADRAHRISSTYKKVTFYQVVAAGTLEERAMEVLARNQDTAGAILDGKVGPVSQFKLTREDVLAMLAASPI